MDGPQVNPTSLKPIIVSEFGTVNGGAPQAAILGARALAQRGCQVLFIYAVGPASELLDHPYIRTIKIDLDDVRTISNPLSAALQGIWSRHAGRELGRILATADSEHQVVHFHQWTRALSPSVLAAAVRRGFPVCITLHDYLAACPTGNFFHHGTHRPCELAPLSPGCMISACDRQSYPHKMVRLVRQVATAHCLQAAQRLHFIHVSAFTRQIIERFLPPHAHHHVILNPFDIAPGAPVEVAHNHAFLFIGRFVPEKGGTVFAQAARACGVRVVFLGSGPEEAAIRRADPTAEIIAWDRGLPLLRLWPVPGRW